MIRIGTGRNLPLAVLRSPVRCASHTASPSRLKRPPRSEKAESPDDRNSIQDSEAWESPENTTGASKETTSTEESAETAFYKLLGAHRSSQGSSNEKAGAGKRPEAVFYRPPATPKKASKEAWGTANTRQSTFQKPPHHDTPKQKTGAADVFQQLIQESYPSKNSSVDSTDLNTSEAAGTFVMADGGRLAKKKNYKIEKLFKGIVEEVFEVENAQVGLPKVRRAAKITDASDTDPQKERARFTESYLNRKPLNPEEIKSYLDTLFSTNLETKTMEQIRQSIEVKCGQFQEILPVVIKDALYSLRDSDNLSSEARNSMDEKLREYETVPEIREKMIFNIRRNFNKINIWTWPNVSKVKLQSNGKFRLDLKLDLDTAILLQCVGLIWADILHHAFMTLFQTLSIRISKTQARRYEYFIGESKTEGTEGDEPHTIHSTRCKWQEKEVLLQHLRAAAEPATRRDDGEESIMRVALTDSYLNLAVDRQQTILRFGVKSSPQTLSFGAILATLEYIGVPQKWLSFFQQYMEMTIRFAGDGTGARIHTCRNGLLAPGVVTTVLSEAVLFCMDYQVYKNTRTFLYRSENSIWFWDHDAEKCVRVRDSVLKFADLTGLEIEESAAMCVNGTLDPRIPSNPIRCKYLELRPSGHVSIDQSMVNDYITKVSKDLESRKEIFSWIPTYNRHMKALVSNLTFPSKCFGEQHLKSVKTTLRGFHSELFPEHDGSVTSYLAAQIQEKFGVRTDDIPIGWYYWPSRLGGLHIYNPFIALNDIASRHEFERNPAHSLGELVKREKGMYVTAKHTWEVERQGNVKRPRGVQDESFMSFREYILLAHGRGTKKLVDTYEELLKVDTTLSYPKWTPEDRVSYERLCEAMQSGENLPEDKLPRLDPYWERVLAMYGPDMIRYFGWYPILGRKVRRKVEMRSTSTTGYIG
ncbi:hypothetical protein BZA77DRAFT_307744 [Pyronema omphalodes]|nr:hypothetical protein BZA77DRAFT_307744 [Pyronema omphalodes]